MNKKISVIMILSAFIFAVSVLLGCAKQNAFAYEYNVGFSVESKSCIFIEPLTKTTIFSKNEDDKRPIASMCKIMTLLLCFEEIDKGNLTFNTEITVSENASGMGGSQVFLEANANYKAEELIKSIVVASANDSCVAMAEYICGSEESFVNRMNEKAKELGMSNTCFVNSTGLPRPGQYSTAKDVSIMFSELLKHEEYFRFSRIWMDSISHPEGRKTDISNTNKLIRFYEGCDAGKTGYTTEAGHCLAATACRNAMRLVCVVINSPDSKTRFKEVSSLFNYGFANYTNKIVVDCEKILDEEILVSGGKQDSVKGVPENSFYIFDAKDNKRALEVYFSSNTELKAPINKGDVVGKISVYENNVEIASINVLAIEDVARKSFKDYVSDVIDEWNFVK